MAAEEMCEQKQEFGLGAVVWYHNDKETGWWPCLVTGINDKDGENYVRLKALGDGHEYGFKEMTSSRLRPFTCTMCKNMVETQLKRFQQKRRLRVREDFISAVREALKHHPMFQLDFDLPDSNTSPSSTHSTPKNPHVGDFWSFLNDSTIFTPGSGSQPGCRVTRSSQRKTLVSVAPSNTPLQCHSTPLSTTESAKSDILVHSHTKNGGERPRKGRDSKLPSERKRQRRVKVATSRQEEGSLSDPEQPVPVRKRLDLDESTDNTISVVPDILTACETHTCIQTSDNGAESTAECRDGLGGTTGEAGDDGVNGEVCKSGGEMGIATSSHVPASCSNMRLKQMSESVVEGRRVEGEKEEDEEEKERERGVNEGEGEGESDSSEDDDLPSFLTYTSTEVVINNLKEGDHIWCKYKTFPHWPALVVKVHPAKKKSRARAMIVYFGDSAEYKPVTIKHKHKRNLARFVFGNQQFEEFMKAGRECGRHAEHFVQSVKEAEAFITAKCNKELTGSAIEMFKQICEKRPASQMPCISWMDGSLHVQRNEKPAVSAFGYRLDSELMDTEGGSEVSEASSESEEEEEDDPIYRLDRICNYFTEIQATLQAIMRGSVQSEYHRLFKSGTTKEKYQLGNCRKYGPCWKWSTGKKVALIHHLEDIARETVSSGNTFTYSRDVLLPEAMIRTISHFEGISEEEARERL